MREQEIYRRSRFSEAASYVDMSASSYQEVAAPWAQAAQAYEVTLRLNDHREALTSLITQAQWILDLGEDWDGDGSQGYSSASLDRAGAVLSQIIDCCWDYWGTPAPLPTINPADEGSIDLSWHEPLHLLINIPANESESATFAALGTDLELYGAVTGKTLPTLVDLLRNGS